MTKAGCWLQVPKPAQAGICIPYLAGKENTVNKIVIM